MIKNLLINWKTTSVGITMIVGSVVHLIYALKAGTANENTWTGSCTGIIGGIGLLAAGDAGVSPPANPTGQPPQTGATS